MKQDQSKINQVYILVKNGIKISTKLRSMNNKLNLNRRCAMLK